MFEGKFLSRRAAWSCSNFCQITLVQPRTFRAPRRSICPRARRTHHQAFGPSLPLLPPFFGHPIFRRTLRQSQICGVWTSQGLGSAGYLPPSRGAKPELTPLRCGLQPWTGHGFARNLESCLLLHSEVATIKFMARLDWRSPSDPETRPIRGASFVVAGSIGG